MSDLIIKIIHQYREPFNDIYSPYFEEIKKYKDNDSCDCDIIFVLGISFENKKTPAPAFSDKYGFLDNGYRLQAAAHLLKDGKKIILVGGHEKDLNKTRPKLMMNHLKNVLNQDCKDIELLFHTPGNTCGNVCTIIEYLKKKKMTEKNVCVLTNFYQIPRTMALFEHLMKIPSPKNIHPIIAELVCEQKGITVSDFYINNKVDKKDLQKRFLNEAKGYLQARIGSYKCYSDDIDKYKSF